MARPDLRVTPYHRRAARWFDGVDGVDADCAVMCRFAQGGFLRLATNPAAFGDEAASIDQAWHLYDDLLGDERVSFRAEPVELEAAWRRFTQGESHSPKVWSEAYFAAFADASRIGLASLDQGFSRYGLADLVIPE